MIEVALTITYAAVGVSLLLNLVRLARGPDPTDRILALDTMVINAIALIMALGIAQHTTLLFEAAMLFAMVGFVTTVAFCRFLLRGDVIE